MDIVSSFCLSSSTETPDNVSMVHDAGPFVEGQKYQMRCDVFNVAPANRLHIRWYKGTEIVTTDMFDDTTLTPVNKSSVLTLFAHRDDHESFWCEASLMFGGGTDPPPTPSQAFKMEVLCRFLALSYLPNVVLFILLYFNHSSSILSSSNFL